MLSLKNLNFSSCGHQFVTAVTQRSNNILCFIARWFLACRGSQPIFSIDPGITHNINHLSSHIGQRNSHPLPVKIFVLPILFWTHSESRRVTSLHFSNQTFAGFHSLQQKNQQKPPLMQATNQHPSSPSAVSSYRRSVSLTVITEVWQFCFYSYSFAKLILHFKSKH